MNTSCVFLFIIKFPKTCIFRIQIVLSDLDNYGVCITDLLHCPSHSESVCTFSHCRTVMRKGKVVFLKCWISDLKTRESEMIKILVIELKIGFIVQLKD